MKSNKLTRTIFWLFIVASIFGLFSEPLGPVLSQAKKTLPWTATGILMSEILLTLGFLTMLFIATPAFFRSFKKSIKTALNDIINLKTIIANFDWAHVATRCDKSRTFWSGYALSVLGAAGDGIIIILAIGKTLPVASWGLMVLPFWDLALTYVIRRSIYQGVKKNL